jgi:hypothetical protein
MSAREGKSHLRMAIHATASDSAEQNRQPNGLLICGGSPHGIQLRRSSSSFMLRGSPKRALQAERLYGR